VRAIIIAVQTTQRRFACETEDGICSVFFQLSGTPVATGDIVSGDVLLLGTQSLEHGGNECRVIGESAMLRRADALALLGETQAARRPD
jgi:hypothetical protein